MLSNSFSIICFLAMSTSVFCGGGGGGGEDYASLPRVSRLSSFPSRNAQTPFRQPTLSPSPSNLSNNSGTYTPGSSYGYGGTAETQSPPTTASVASPAPSSRFGANSAARFGPTASPGLGRGLGSMGGIQNTLPSSGSATATATTPPTFQPRFGTRFGPVASSSQTSNSASGLPISSSPSSPSTGNSSESMNSRLLSSANSGLGRSNSGLSRSNSRLESETSSSPGVMSSSLTNPEIDVNEIINQLETKLKSATISQSKPLIQMLEDIVSKINSGSNKMELSLDGKKYNVNLGPMGNWQKQNNMIKAKSLSNSQKDTLQWISNTISKVLSQQNAKRLSSSPSFNGQDSSSSESKSPYIHDITSMNEWNAKVLNNPKPVILDVWATTCKPCRAIAPIMKKIVDEQNGDVELVKINADETRLAGGLGYTSLPTVQFFYNGKAVGDKIVGGYPESKYRQAFKNFLESI